MSRLPRELITPLSSSFQGQVIVFQTHSSLSCNLLPRGPQTSSRLKVLYLKTQVGMNPVATSPLSIMGKPEPFKFHPLVGIRVLPGLSQQTCFLTWAKMAICKVDSEGRILYISQYSKIQMEIITPVCKAVNSLMHPAWAEGRFCEQLSTCNVKTYSCSTSEWQHLSLERKSHSNSWTWSPFLPSWCFPMSSELDWRKEWSGPKGTLHTYLESELIFSFIFSIC